MFFLVSSKFNYQVKKNTKCLHENLSLHQKLKGLHKNLWVWCITIFAGGILTEQVVVMLAFSSFIQTFVQNIYVFMVILLPLICGGAVLTVIITSVITKTVSSADTGAALGMF